MSPKQVIAKYQPSILRRLVLFCTFVSGIVLHLVGLYDPIKYRHLLWLAHYLLKSGKTRYLILSEKEYASVVESVRYAIDSVSSWQNRYPRYFTVDSAKCESLYQTIGKARFKIVKNVIALVDYYVFYATDNEVDSHGWYHAKDSKYRSYSDITIPIGKIDYAKIWNRIPKRYQRLAFAFILKNHSVNRQNFKQYKRECKYFDNGMRSIASLTLKFHSSLFEAWNLNGTPIIVFRILKERSHNLDGDDIISTSLNDVSASDGLFVPLGKPFLTVGRYILPEDNRRTLRQYLSDDN